MSEEAPPPPPAFLATEEPPVEELPWKRLDSRMLLVHPVQELIRFFPAVLGAFFLGGRGSGTQWELIGIAIPIALGILRFFTTSYRVTASQVELRRGLIGTKVLTARLDRVRAVELTSTLIHRVLGLARVEIGTASAKTAGEEKFALDSLALAPAREMRTALLHRVSAAQALQEGPHPTGEPVEPNEVPQPGGTDEVLVKLDPGWVRYAPLTSSGNVIAAGFLAVVLQFGERAGINLDEGGTVEQWFVRAGIVVALLLVVVAFLVIGAVLAVLGYLVANWEFTLSRDARGRSFQSKRGLLTRTETSLESARLRGLELGQPLGLRLAGAARLNAIVTGLSTGERSSTLLVPPAPQQVATHVGDTVLDLPGGEASPLRVPLRQHGPAARRRRLVRALAGALAVLVALSLTANASTIPWGTLIPALVLLPLAAWLGLDRYRRLGHTLTGDHLVVASGTLRGRRDVLQRSGIIGWNIEESFFQRRAGLCTLTATTAAGRQQYAALDIPVTEATTLAATAVPGLLEQFLD